MIHNNLHSTIALLRFLLVASLPVALPQATFAATLSEPVFWGTPDQSHPWGQRRPVTDEDRALIQSYRSKQQRPLFSTTFTDVAEFKTGWDIITDDVNGMLSCRRPESVEISPAGLRLKTIAGTDTQARPNFQTRPWSTGYIASKAKYGYGFFEANMKIAPVSGLNNAFWFTTDDNFEIDAAEANFPSYIHMGLQYWPHNKDEKHAGMGWGAKFKDNLAQGFHDIGILWTPTDIIFEIDGEPIAAATRVTVKGPFTIRFSTAVADFAGKVPDHPEGHNMVVRSVKVIPLITTPTSSQ